ncbi:MAG: Tim44/TimA family putative adaptor protein [Alphaproteobacteria bacterium]|nr:Tim44/TimA family putative adaptor protein [Alphaproteobacteria bacterium]
MITLIFAILTFVLLIKLNEVLGVNIGFKIKRENLNDLAEESTEIREISEQERIWKTISRSCPKFDERDFLKKAEKVFELVFKAYADGDKSTLKDLLSPRTFKAFSMAIDDRKERGETLEGSILQFAETELIDASVSSGSIYVTVKFITDQTTALRSTDGTILEGSPDYVNSRTDIWVFSRKENSTDPRWFLHEIKSED